MALFRRVLPVLTILTFALGPMAIAAEENALALDPEERKIYEDQLKRFQHAIEQSE